MNAERENLNKIYCPLHTKNREIVSCFKEGGLEAESGWYNGHYSKDGNGEYKMDYFPIPVISVKGLCDIEIGFGEITVSAKLGCGAALVYSFEGIGVPFEAYGVEDYLADYYCPGMSLEEFRENIKSGGEKEIGFSFLFDGETVGEELFDFVRILRNEGFYY